MKLGVSTYSFWHFRGERLPVEKYVEKAYDLGFDGVEVLVDHVENSPESELKAARLQAFSMGLHIYSLSIHNNFVMPSAEGREKEVERVREWLHKARALGADVMRIDSGRWRTVRSFDELMARGGEEPAIEGYGENDAIAWVEESVRKLLPTAEDLGIILGMENHWGISASAKNMVELFQNVSSPYFRAILDTGNFIHDTYEQIQMVAPYAALVHAKTYFGGGEWYSLDIDYDKIFSILRNAGFKGWVSLEYEGKEEYESGVRKSAELLRKAMLR